MITGLDHVVVLLSDLQAGAKAYELLLGRAPSWRSQSEGAETVLFTLDNMTLELMAPAGASPVADRIRTVIKIWGEGLASIAFRVADIAKMHRRLDRLALKPEPIAEVESRDTDSGGTLHWRRTRAATEMTRSSSSGSSPANVSLQSGQTHQFTVDVTGPANHDVTWTATGGTIDSTGLFTAPTTLGDVVVTAMSLADREKKASATVTIVARDVSVDLPP